MENDKKNLDKFEDFLQYDMSSYDKIPYEMDRDFCTSDKITHDTGNIIKYQNVNASNDNFYIINNNKENKKRL